MYRMKNLSRTLGLAALAIVPIALFAPTLTPTARAQDQHVSMPLWPHATPEPPQTTAPETDTTKPTDGFISGHRTARLTNITIPTLTVFPPHEHTTNTGTAVLVFPGGSYQMLAWDGEGLDTCHWLNSVGITCVLVKYRVPQPHGEAGHYPADPSDLEDAQQAMRITRAHAADWHLDPTHIGVMGFSAGANLAVLLCTHPNDDHVESTPAAADANTHISARADFAILVYPAYLAAPPDETQLFSAYTPNEFTPTTFLIQAENDRGYGKNALVYYRALMDAHIPAELHYFATGGHGFGMHPPNAPEEHWPHLAEDWLRTINVLPPREHASPAGGTPTPCQMPQPPGPGRPSNNNTNTNNPNNQNTPNNNVNSQTQTSAAASNNPNCWSTQP